MPPTVPDELFTWESLATLGGAATATFVVSNALQKVFNFNPKWLALALAELISLVVTLRTGISIEHVVIGLVNGVLVYGTAVGANSIGSALSKPTPETPVTAHDRAEPKFAKPVAPAPRSFGKSWWGASDDQRQHAS